MSAEHRRRIIRRPTTLVGWIAFFVGGFVLAGAGAALAYFLLSVIYATGNYALAQASKLSSPTAAVVTENSSTSLHVAWTDPAQQLTGAHYKVVRTSSTQVCLVTSSASSCTVTGLTEGTHYSFTVTAVIGTNWQSTSTPASFTTLGVTTTSLPSGTVGTAYTKKLTSTGGTGTDTWSLHSGTLPTGLSLTTSTGKIHGTPTTAGTFSGLVFRVTDSNSVTATSVSLTIVVTKGAENTTITLSRSAASVIYGSETTETFTVIVTGSAGGGYPEGTVKVKKSTTAVLCMTSTITAHTATNRTATYHCHLTPGTQLTASSYTGVKAKYTGGNSSTPSYTYNASPTSSTVSFTVTPKSVTTTSIALARSTASVVYGSETSETFTVTITGTTGDGYPTGTVTVEKSVTSGTVCLATLTSHTTNVAKYKCSLTASQLTAGAYTVKAVYAGGASSNPDYSYTTATSSTVSFTVTPKSVTTTSIALARSTASVVYGSETSETFTVTITGTTGDGYPTGTVTVEKSVTSGTVCLATLTSHTTNVAKYKCSLTASQLTAGAYTVKAVYAGGASSNPDYSYTTATSSTVSFTVTPKSVTTTSIALARSTASVVYGSETSETFTVTITGTTGDGYPTGTVTVEKSVTSGTVCLATLTSHTTNVAKYKCSLTASQLTAGAYTVKAVYAGGASSNPDYSYTTATSSTVSFTVTKATESSTTTLNPVTTPKTFGSEGQTLSGKVSGSGSFGKPEGTVTVKATGTAITGCTTLSLTAGAGTTATFTCTLGTSTLSVGTHSIVATYTPGTPSSSNVNYSYSTSASTSQTLTVTSASVCTGTRSFTLAAGATVGFTAVGGGGGASNVAGGPGANITGTVHNTTVSHAKTISYKIGCKGTPGKDTSSTSPGGTGGGGYAAGGHGGHGHSSSGHGFGGGGGGGATDIQIGTSVIAVAGGGGGGSASAGTLVTTTRTPATPATGATGTNETNSNRSGGGGGGGGDKTAAAGGAVNNPGAGGFNYKHANTTITGVTFTITPITSGNNAGNPGSVTFYNAPTVTAVYPAYAEDSHTIHMTIIGTTFAPGATVSLWSACSTKDAATLLSSVTWVNSTTLRVTVTTTATSSQHCVDVTEGAGGAFSSGHTASSGNVFTQKSNGVLTTVSGTVTILPGGNGTLTLTVTSSTASLCSGVLSSRALYFSEPTVSVGTLTCTGASPTYHVSGTVTVGAGAFTSPPKVTVTLTGGSNADAVTDETAITVDPPATSPGTPLTAPTVTTLTPASGTEAGGTWVTITGTNFRWTAVVTFGGTASPSVTVNSTTSITALSPAHAAGTVAVSVTTNNGTATTSSGFTYITGSASPPPATAPTVTSLTPATGPGTTAVTITGTNLTTVISVLFGTVPGTTVTVSPTGTTLTVKAPAGTVGTAVTVSLLPGSGTPVPAGKFTYTSAQSSSSSTPPKTPPAPVTPPATG